MRLFIYSITKQRVCQPAFDRFHRIFTRTDNFGKKEARISSAAGKASPRAPPRLAPSAAAFPAEVHSSKPRYVRVFGFAENCRCAARRGKFASQIADEPLGGSHLRDRKKPKKRRVEIKKTKKFINPLDKVFHL